MRVLFFALLMLSAFSSVAQDLLISKSGDTTKAIVLAVFYDNVQYRKFENAEGALLTIYKYDLSKVIYANGQVDDFTKFVKPISSDTAVTIALDSSQIYYTMGTKDAFRYYRGYKPAATGTYVVSTLFFPLGIAVAGLCASSEPIDNLGFPDEKLMLNPDYHNAYVAGAQKRKSRRVWSNFFYGFGTAFMVGLVIVSTQKR